MTTYRSEAQPLTPAMHAKRTASIDMMSRGERLEANRERDGYYMSREEFAHWCQAMAEWYRGKTKK